MLHHVWVPLPAPGLFWKHFQMSGWYLLRMLKSAQVVSNSPDSSAPFLRYVLYFLQRLLWVKGSELLGSSYSFSAPFWLQNRLLLFLLVIYWLIGCFSLSSSKFHGHVLAFVCCSVSLPPLLIVIIIIVAVLTPLNFMKVSFMICHHSLGVFLCFQFINIVVLYCAFKIAVDSGITSLILFFF